MKSLGLAEAHGMRFVRAVGAGAAGAVLTNMLHEVVRRLDPQAPRIDLLGMQTLARLLRASGAEPPTGSRLYRATLAGDMISNSVYFAAVALAPRASVPVGLGLGVLAGLGAVLVPARTTLDATTTGRTPRTRLLTVLYYTAGGVAAGALYRAGRAHED